MSLRSLHLKHIIFIAMLSLVLYAGCANTIPKEQSVDFTNDPAGKTPAGFTSALTGGGGPGLWMVQSQPDGGNALVQETTDDTSYRFPMCIYEDAVARDIAVETKFKSISGKTDQAGGLVLRYTPENYYIARANALEDNVNLFKTVNGKRSKILEVDETVASDAWHTLRFEAKASHLKVIFDGKVVIEADDNTFTNPGKVGLWTKADSVTAFKDFKIEPVR